MLVEFLSRKAMKKTIERLQKNAIESIQYYKKILQETEGKVVNQIIFDNIMESAGMALWDTYNYAKVLEDAYSELAEPFDKKLEVMEKAVKSITKPVENKVDKKKQFYT